MVSGDHMEKIFVPHELKTVEIDVEKKVFKINGENFGKGCTGFTISCGGLDDFSIEVELNARIQYATYQGKNLTFIKDHPAFNTPYLCGEENSDMEDETTGAQIAPQTPADVIHWLTECSKDGSHQCKDCPYNHGEYSDGCGMLLRDAATLLIAAYGKEDSKL